MDRMKLDHALDYFFDPTFHQVGFTYFIFPEFQHILLFFKSLDSLVNEVEILQILEFA